MKKSSGVCLFGVPVCGDGAVRVADEQDIEEGKFTVGFKFNGEFKAGVVGVKGIKDFRDFLRVEDQEEVINIFFKEYDVVGEGR